MAVVLLLVLGTGVVGALLVEAWQEEDRAQCSSNLKQLFLECQLWSCDHNEVFPKSLELLYHNYIGVKELYSCPLRPAAMSYVCVPDLKASDRSDWILVYELADNHAGKGMNVVYIDGRVQWETDIATVKRRGKGQLRAIECRRPLD